jgi:amino acid adenylation domain-containing protein
MLAIERTLVVAPAEPRHAPLAAAQQGLWFVNQRDGPTGDYNIVSALRLRGALDPDVLARALAALADRQAILRTRFAVLAGEVNQVVDGDGASELNLDDLRALDQIEQQDAVAAAVQAEHERPFALVSGPVWRARLLRLAGDEHVLLLAVHHIVSDAWSQRVLCRELLLLYDAFAEGRPNPLPPLPLQYADYAQAQQENSRRVADRLAYWTRTLSGIPDRLALPADYARQPSPTAAAGRCEAAVPAPMVAAVKRLGREHGASLYMTLLAAFAVLLARYAGQPDIVIGTPVTNRPETRLESLVGLFINMVAMRIRVRPQMTVRALLAEVRRTALEAWAHQDVPFARVADALTAARQASVHPVFQVGLTLQNTPRFTYESTTLRVEPMPWQPTHVRYDLDLLCRMNDHALTLTWMYRRDLFTAGRIEQMAHHYVRVLEAMAAAPNQQLDSIELQDSAELTAEWDQTRADYKAGIGWWDSPRPRLVTEWWTRTVGNGAPALECGDRRLTYAELRRWSNGVAHAIAACGTDEGARVAICTADRLALAAGIVGALKAGRAFAPIDADLPDERVHDLLAVARPSLMLTDVASAARVEAFGRHDTIALERCIGRDDPPPADAWPPSRPAYVGFTSGSTGVPLAVLGRLGGLDHHLQWIIDAARIGAGTRISQLTRPSFTAYLRDLFAPLCAGATSCIPARADTTADGRTLAAWLGEERVEVVFCTPTTVRLLLDGPRPIDDCAALRHIFVTGEPLRSADVRRWLDAVGPRVTLTNLYGATETTLAKLVHTIGADDADRLLVPIGRPLPGVAAMVVDARGAPCLPGSVGELVVWSPFLSHGYLDGPAPAVERFVHLSPSDRNDVMFRTGDLARMRGDGLFEYVGRADTQVKIRGNRIELAEVERALLAESHVRDAVVVAHQHDDGDTRLTAYVEGSVDRTQMRSALVRRLPASMIPTAIVCMAALPRTAGGKVDRLALPPADVAVTAPSSTARTAQEAMLCALFAEVLGVQAVGPDHDFFDLGGHSLLAIRLTSRIAAAVGIEISVIDFFDHPTPASLAALLAAARGEESS